MTDTDSTEQATGTATTDETANRVPQVIFVCRANGGRSVASSC